MKVHTDRSILEELQDLYELAVREHGDHSLSSQIIGESLRAERLRLGQAPGVPLHAAAQAGRAAHAGRLPA